VNETEIKFYFFAVLIKLNFAFQETFDRMKMQMLVKTGKKLKVRLGATLGRLNLGLSTEPFLLSEKEKTNQIIDPKSQFHKQTNYYRKKPEFIRVFGHHAIESNC
jgi:hypothetical protein